MMLTALEPVAVEMHKAEFMLTLLLFAVFFVLGEILRPKPKIEGQRPASLGDFKFPTATEGRPVPIIWGTVKLAGPNVIWYGDLRQEAITEKIKTGIFSSKKITRGFRYYLGVQMALCRGGTTPVGNLLRIWVGDELLWNGNVSTDGAAIDINEPEFFGGEELGGGGLVGPVRFFRGSTTQTPAAYLIPHQSISGQTPAYRGTCYVLLEHFLLGTSTSIKPWAFEARRIPNGLALAQPTVNGGNDANPMNVIYEILTNEEWGLGMPASDIDTANFAAAADSLRLEGNGFSFVLDNEREAAELVREIERQIDGVLYVDRTTGKYRINLARGGYTLSTKRALNQSNVLEISTFTRGSWQDTTNNVLVWFASRVLDYKETYAGAQDMANIRLQGNKLVSATPTYPGVKNAVLANNLAWRDLRLLSYPIARAELVVDRTLWDHNPGDVVRWTDPTLGFEDLAMRITRIDLGHLEEGRITVSLVQDIFVWDTGVFTAPGATQWTTPPQVVVAIPEADSLVFESPRAFIRRMDDQSGILDRIWCGARHQGDAAVDMDIYTRPNTGNYTDGGDVSGFLVAGTLDTSITAAGAQGSITLTIDPTLESLGRLQGALEEVVSQEDCGQRLANLVRIGSEFFSFRNVAESGGKLVLSNGYRGFLDSAPASHSAGARVWILLGNLTDRSFAAASTQQVKLLPRSSSEKLSEASAPAITVNLNNRGRRPYPPVAFRANTTLYPTGGVDLDSSGSGGPGGGLDDRGVAVSYVRRDFRLLDEASAVLNEDNLPADFPAAASTQYAVEVRNDPAGANTLLFTTAWNSGTNQIKISRSRILRFTAGVLPSQLRMIVKTRHNYEGVLFEATQNLAWDFDVASALLAGDHNWGVLGNGTASSNFAAPSTGTYTLNIGTALASGAVQVSLNGGAWNTVIAAGNLTGTFAATAADNIRVRHQQAGSTDSQTLCELVLSGTSRAYAIFTF